MTVLTYSLTRDQLEAIRTKLATENVLLVGDKGDTAHQGVKVEFDYVEPTLTVTIVDHGGYPEFIVKHKINGWFKEETT
jgi:hypothetical protein